MKLELVHGRPDSVEGRLEKEIRTYDLLDELGIPYERIDHEAVPISMPYLHPPRSVKISFCATGKRRSFTY